MKYSLSIRIYIYILDACEYSKIIELGTLSEKNYSIFKIVYAIGVVNIYRQIICNIFWGNSLIFTIIVKHCAFFSL